MLEFLQECDSNNMYNRAHDCELHLNAFNCLTPIATFFEVTFKALYSEFFPNRTFEQNLNLHNLLHEKEFVDRLKTELNFSAIHVVDMVRKKSNELKHSESVSPVNADDKKAYFRCLFNFCASYYFWRTGKKKPSWDDSLYNNFLIDDHARELVESELSDRIFDLSQKQKRSEKELNEAKRQIESFEKQLQQAKESTVPADVLSKLKKHIRELEDEGTEKARQQVLLEQRVRQAETEKEKAEEELHHLQTERMRSMDFEQQQTLLKKKIDAASQQILELQQENKALIQKMTEISTQRDNELKKLDENASKLKNEEILKLQKELEAAERKRIDAEHRLIDFEEKLARDRARLFVSNTHIDIDRVQKDFFEVRDKELPHYQRQKEAEEQIQELAPRLPRCPKCNSVLSVGKGNGLYWKCPAYRSDGSGCDAKTRNVRQSEMPIAESLWKLQESKKGAEKELEVLSKQSFSISADDLKTYKTQATEYVAYPYSFEKQVPKAYLFQSLAVPSQLFAERESLKHLQDFSRFLVSTNMESQSVPEADRTIYSLAIRLLNRGIVLPEEHRVVNALKSKFNRDKFGRINSLFEYIQYQSPEFRYDSPRERKFAENFLAPILGSQWATFTLTQVGFDVLLPGDSQDFAEQRVDFLVQKNGKKIVIEIDGPEHKKRQYDDERRDYALRQKEYTVIRFSNDEIDNNDEKVRQELCNTLGDMKRGEYNTELDDRFLVACKLMHQVSVAIVKMLEQGVIEKHANLCLDVSTDMFTDVEQQYILTLAVEEVLDILENYDEIYSVPFELNLLDSAVEQTIIVVGNGTRIGRHILIRDCCWPYNALCSIESFAPNIMPQHCNRKNLEFFLHYIFGFDSFRDGQYEAIKRLLMQKNSIILLPTGAGKSIIYQLSSFIAPGMIIVISPLRSLMEDQVNNLDINRGITNVIMLRSEQTKEGKEKREKALRLIRHNSTAMLYISPERLQIPSFRQSVQKMMENNSVFAVAIDEAHCVSEWGHDFKPAYLNIANATRMLFKKGNYVPTIFALTGTASEHVLKDVQAVLEIQEQDAIVMPATFDRHELRYSIVHCFSEDKSTQIASIIKNDLPAKFGIDYHSLAKLNGDQTFSGIVFAPIAARKEPGQYDALSVSHALSKVLPEMGISCYFSKTPEGYDEETWNVTIQQKAEDFKKNKLNLLVATKAFGMGIDKSNVRFIIHDGIPASLEEYYQEAGRAGRGRDVSQCILVFSDDCASIHESLLEPDLPLEKMQEAVKAKKQSIDRDDLSAILYFHANSYQGIEKECANVRTILENISEINFHRGITREYQLKDIRQKDSDREKNLNEEQMQKALMRLITLGIIEDYTYDYRGHFGLTYGSLAPEDISEHYVAFIRRDNEQRVAEAQQKMQAISSFSGLDYAVAVVHVLIEYIYDSVEKSRRAAARLMYTTAKEAAALTGEEQEKYFRSAILSYFSTSERTKDLHTILQAEDAGIPDITQYLPLPVEDREYSDSEMQRFRETNMMVGRMLESTPDQPSLLILRGICGMMLGNVSAEQVANDIVAAARFANERYSVTSETILTGTSSVLDSILGYYPRVFDATIAGISRSGFSKKQVLNAMLDCESVSDEHRSYLMVTYADEMLKEIMN